MKIAVIGVGGVGSAACRMVVLAGHDVVGFEQYSLGHKRGSSHGESRIIRYAYPEQMYTQMMGQAYPLWAELEDAAEEELLVRCGGLLIGPPDHPMIRATKHALDAAGQTSQTLTGTEAANRFPALAFQPGEVALYQGESGFLRSSRCVAANVRLSIELGADVRQETPVLDITEHGSGVVVRTSESEEFFDRAIVTAGPWIGKLLHSLHLPLQVEQRQFIYVNITGDERLFMPEALPVWIDTQSLYYGFPSDGQIVGVKLASHDMGQPLDPDDPNRPIIEQYIEHALAYAVQRLPHTGSEVMHAQSCLYTMTPDEHFIIDRAPAMDNVWLCSACSGHGFKFSILLGKIMVDLATTGSYPHSLDSFSAARFA